MSTVRYFDDIPHIGRFGTLSEETGTSTTIFYRNGTRFTIRVDEKDVHGTTFHSLWRPLLKDDWQPGDSILDKYNKFFDLVVFHSLNQLQEINPVKPHWITLRDYLHTLAYHLKLVSDSTGPDGVCAAVTNGPQGVAAYELQPAAKIKNMPETIQEYSSSDLFVLDKEADWRTPPQKFRTTDGLICYFKGCKKSSRNVQTGKVTNMSLNTIEAHLHLYKYGQEMGDSYATRRSRVLGIVTDVASTSDQPETAAGQHEEDPKRALVAGILLPSPTRSPHAQSLAEAVKQHVKNATADFNKQVQRWRIQIEEDVAYLHSLGIFWGGREHWFFINHVTVLIDAESGDAYMSLDTALFLDDDDDDNISNKEARAKLTDMDKSAIENLFEKWLPEEVSKERSEGG